MDLLCHVSKLPIFCSTDFSILQEMDIANKCKVTRIKKGSVIHLQNESCTHLDVIISGIVSVQAMEASGNSITIASFGSGDCLGSNLLFSSKAFYPMIVMAKTNVIIYSFDKKTILQLCNRCAVFLENFLKEVSDKAQVLTGKIHNIALKTMREKILDTLKMEQIAQNSNKITLPFSKKEWSELLGVQRPSLSRELNKMKKEGLLDFHNRQIVLFHFDN